MTSTNTAEKYQSDFRKYHSTETALVKIANDIRLNMDTKMPSVLVLLDVSAASDTVDHTILLHRCRNLIGISGTVFNWFKSYLTDRKFYVSMGKHTSSFHQMPLDYKIA